MSSSATCTLTTTLTTKAHEVHVRALVRVARAAQPSLLDLASDVLALLLPHWSLSTCVAAASTCPHLSAAYRDTTGYRCVYTNGFRQGPSNGSRAFRLIIRRDHDAPQVMEATDARSARQ